MEEKINTLIKNEGVPFTKPNWPYGSNKILIYHLFSQPYMERKLKIQDTCGIHNLHAMPGVIGGIVGAITAAAASEPVYGKEG